MSENPIRPLCDALQEFICIAGKTLLQWQTLDSRPEINETPGNNMLRLLTVQRAIKDAIPEGAREIATIDGISALAWERRMLGDIELVCNKMSQLIDFGAARMEDGFRVEQDLVKVLSGIDSTWRSQVWPCLEIAARHEGTCDGPQQREDGQSGLHGGPPPASDGRWHRREIQAETMSDLAKMVFWTSSNPRSREISKGNDKGTIWAWKTATGVSCFVKTPEAFELATQPARRPQRTRKATKSQKKPK